MADPRQTLPRLAIFLLLIMGLFGAIIAGAMGFRYWFWLFVVVSLVGVVEVLRAWRQDKLARTREAANQ